MKDVTELISKVSQELGPHASDEEISKKVLEAIEALPESDRAQVLEQLVKGISSGQLRHLDKEVDADRQADGGTNISNTENASESVCADETGGWRIAGCEQRIARGEQLGVRSRRSDRSHAAHDPVGRRCQLESIGLLRRTSFG
jgi:hypothetical protein